MKSLVPADPISYVRMKVARGNAIQSVDWKYLISLYIFSLAGAIEREVSTLK
jgi:hypothetical protein